MRFRLNEAFNTTGVKVITDKILKLLFEIAAKLTEAGPMYF